MLEDKSNKRNESQLIDRKLRSLSWAQSQWDSLWPDLSWEEDDYIIIFPQCNRECNLYGMKYLDTFLQRRSGKQAIILTRDSFVRNCIRTYSDNIKKIICLEEKMLSDLVELYQFHVFHSNVVVVALDEPFCRKASGLVGIKQITIEQMIAIGVYSIIPFRPLGKEKVL